MKKIILIFYLIALFVSPNVFSQSIECGDLFTKYGEKPEELEFITCKEGKGQSIVEAVYRVSSKESNKVEKYLIKKYGLGKLKWACCGWESENGKNGQFKNTELTKINADYYLEIIMFASAEDKDGGLELNRDKIPFFTVIVKIIEV